MCGLLVLACGNAQDRDPGARAVSAISTATGQTLKLTFEQRGRFESHTGSVFGNEVDSDTGLFRTRLGLNYTPVKWLKFSVMVQDSRAPWYGSGAPATVRDQTDWHEAYFELRPAYKQGFGMTAGRMMLTYGEGRLIGSPQWSNLSRTYDHARVYWRSARAQVEVLLVSPVKVRIGEFNQPVPGDRIWGTYNAFPNIYRKQLLEAYVLHRQQNRPGGFTSGTRLEGTDRASLNTFGFRLTGPLADGVKYSLEAAFQEGRTGAADLRAGAWFAGLSRRWTIGGKTLDVGVEYKYASGTANPADPKRSGTFDQLSPANHDKFGHLDLLGWRNIHNARSLAVLGLTRRLAVNFMYDNSWLAHRKDAVYNGAGRPIARDPTGAAGRNIGQEADVFATYKRGHFTFGAGGCYFFTGKFIEKTTRGLPPTYVYLYYMYSL